MKSTSTKNVTVGLVFDELSFDEMILTIMFQICDFIKPHISKNKFKSISKLTFQNWNNKNVIGVL